jgi:hypothetical protein
MMEQEALQVSVAIVLASVVVLIARALWRQLL